MKDIIEKFLSDEHTQFIVDLSNVSKKIKGLNENYNHSTLIGEIHESLKVLLRLQTFKLKDQEKLLVEELKVILLEALLRNINGQSETAQNTKKDSTYNRFLRYFASSAGVILTGFNGFITGRAILQLIFSLTNPFSFSLCAVFGILESLMFIGIDVINSSKAFGVSYFKTKPLMNIYQKQIDKLQTVHQVLLSPRGFNQLSESDFTAYQQTLNLFHDDIKCQNNKLTLASEKSAIRKSAQWITTGLNSLMSLGSGMLLGKSILCLLGVGALASNPIGWGITVAIGICSLMTFVILKRKSIFNLVDFVIGNPKSIKKSQDNFINGNNGVNQFNHDMQFLIAEKRKIATNEKTLQDKIALLETKVKHNESQKITVSKKFKRDFTDTRTSTGIITNRLFFQKNKKLKIHSQPESCSNNQNEFYLHQL